MSGSLAKISAKTGLTEAQALAAILKDAGQPRIVEAQEVADAVLHMARLPLTANIPFLTIMARDMPFVGRG